MFFHGTSNDRVGTTRTASKRAKNRSRRLLSRRSLRVESLEERRLLATWVGGTGNLWSTPVNWSPNIVPDGLSGEPAVFNTAATVTLDVDLTASPIAVQFDAGSAVTIDASGGYPLNVSSVTQNAGTNVINPAITGSGGVTVAGGSLTLTANNTFSGGTTITSGTLQVGNGGATGSLGAGTTLNNGTLVWDNSNGLEVTAANAITGAGALTILAGNMLVRYDAGGSVSSGTITVDGTGSGNSSAFEIWAPNPVTLNNNFILNSMGPYPNRGAINQDGGAGLVTLNGSITLAGDSRIGIGGGSWNNMTVNGQITGGGKLYVYESPTAGTVLTLTNGSNNYSGGTEIQSGTLKAAAANATSSGPVNVAAGATWDLGVDNQTVAGLTGAGKVIRSNVVTTGADGAALISTSKNYLQKLDFGNGGGANVNGVPFDSVATNGAGWSLTGAGNLFGEGGSPTGYAQLMNDFYYNGYPGELTFTGLTLGQTYNAVLYTQIGSWPNRPQNATFTNGGDSQQLLATDPGTVGYYSYQFIARDTTASITMAPNTADTFHWFGASLDLVSTVTPTLTVGDANNYAFSGVISGETSLVKQGGGVQALSGKNSYSGTTTSSNGTLQIADASLAHYAMDGNGNDVSGKGHDATAQGSPSYTSAGKFGQAITLNGSDQYVTVPYSPDLELNSFTVSVWVQINAQPGVDAGGGPALLSTRNGGETTFDLQYMQPSSGVFRLHADIGSGGGWLNTGADYTLPGALSGWNMITYTVTSSGYTIYVNGSQVSTGAVGGTPLLMKAGETLSFGSQQAGGGTWGAGGWLNASLDEITIFGSVLEGPAVSALYSGSVGSLPATTPVLVANGATLDLRGVSNQMVASLSDVAGGGGTVTSSVPGSSTLNMNTTTSTTFSGTVQNGSGQLSLVKTGAGTQTLIGGNIAYSGSTAVGQGRLVLQNVNTSYSSAISIASGATLEYNANGLDVVQAGTTLSGAGTLLKTGPNQLRFGGAGNVYWRFSGGASIDVQGGTLVGGSSIQDDWTNNYASLNIANAAVFNGVEANIRVDALTGSGTFSGGYPGAGYASDTFGVNGGSGIFYGTIRDEAAPLNLVKVGAGTQTLAGSDSYSGSTVVNGGVLVAASNNALGSTATGTTVNPGASLAVYGDGLSIPENLTINGTGVANAGALVNVTGANQWTGTVSTPVLVNGEVRINSMAGTLTLASTLDLQFSRLDVGGSGNTSITGNIISNSPAANARYIRIQNNGSAVRNLSLSEIEAFGLGVAPASWLDNANDLALNTTGAAYSSSGPAGIAHGSTASINDGQRQSGADSFNLNPGAGNFIILDLAQNRTLERVRLWQRADDCCQDRLSDFTLSLLADNGGTPGAVLTNTVYPGQVPTIRFADIATYSASSVVKDGDGTLTLGGNNTYTGTTSVNAGVLVAANGNALGTSAAATTVANGATLGLQGGITLSGKPIILDGAGAAGQPGALANISGNNTIAAASPITAAVVSLGQIGLGSAIAGDTLTINADIDLQVSKLTAAGAGNVVINGTVKSTNNGIDPAQRDYILGNAQAGLPGLNPLAFWEFNETSGATAVDSSANHNNGTLMGLATRSTGRSGAVGDYTLDVSDYRGGGSVDIPAASGQFQSITNNNQATLAFWSFVDPLQNLRSNTTFQALGAGGERVVFTHSPWSDGVTYWDAGQGERVQTAGLPASAYTDGWHWWAMTKNSAGATQALYRDGVLMASGAGTQAFATIASLVIAPDHRGQLDDVLLLNQALSPSQITDLYNLRNGKGMFAADNSLAKTGDGTLTLAGNNTYTGDTTVAAGVLKLGNLNALGTTAAGTTILDGGTLDVNGVYAAGSSNEAVSVSGAGAGGLGAIINTGGAIVNSGFGNLTLNGDTTIGGPNRWDIRGGTTFTGNNHTLTKIGGFQIAVSSPLNGADIVVDAGRLTIQTSNALGTGGPTDTTIINPGAALTYFGAYTVPETLIFNGGSLQSENNVTTFTGPITLNAMITVYTNGGGHNIALTGTIDGAGGITKTGGSMLTLTGSNTYSGGTILSDGTLQINGSTTGVNSIVNGPVGTGALTLNAGLLQGDGTAQTLANSLVVGGNLTIASAAGGSLTFDGTSLTTPATAALTADSTLTLLTPTAIVDALSGPFRLAKLGTERLLLTGASISLGSLDVAAGPLTLGAAGATTTISGGIQVGDTFVAGGGSATLDIPDGSLTTAWIQLGNTPGAAITATVNQLGGSVRTTGDPAEFAGVRLGHYPAATTFYNLSGGTLLVDNGRYLTCAVDGTGTFNQTGGEATATRVVVNARGGGGGNGTFTVAGGRFNVAGDGIVNDGTGAAAVNVGGLGGTIRATASFASSLPITLGGAGANAAAFDSNGNTITLSGPLGGAAELHKLGDGTLTLAGANTYNAGTTISAGTLLANNGSGSATGSAAVAVDAAATLGGTGGVAGPVTVSGFLSPGAGPSLVGTLAIQNGVTFNAGSNFVVDIASATSADGLVVGAGTVTINAGALISGSTAPSYVPNVGVDTFTLISFLAPAATTISGTFTSQVDPPPPASSPATIALGVRPYSTDYNGSTSPNDGNNLVIAPVGATRVWDGQADGGGDSGNDNWSNPLNWVGDVAPIVADKLVFDNTGVGIRPNPYNDFAGASFISITINSTAAAGYNLLGNSVSLASSLTDSSTANDQLSLAVGGTASLGKTGAGTLTVLGANTYAGGTTVNSGTLVVDTLSPNSGTGTGPVTVDGGATLTGSGTLAGPVTVSGVIHPLGAPQALTVGGPAVLDATSDFQLKLTGDPADRLRVNGTVRLNGGTLNLTRDLIAPPFATPVTILSSTGALSGTFQGYANGSIVSVDGQNFKLTYVNNAGGGSVVLTPVLADVAVALTAVPGSVIPGGVITYTLRVTNSGPADALNVVVTDVFPPHALFLSSTTLSAWTLDAPPVGAGGTITLTAPKLAARGTAVFTIVVQVDPSATIGSTITNTIDAATTGTYDSKPANNTKSVTTTVSSSGIALVANPDDPTKTDLLVLGRPIADNISFTPKAGGQIMVTFNGKNTLWRPTGRIVVHGGAGNDMIRVNSAIRLSAFLYGEAGNDTLMGGAGNDVLVGGDGNDTLVGNLGRNLVIGGQGSNRLNSTSALGDNLNVAGSTNYDATDKALSALLAEWSGSDDYLTRVANLQDPAQTYFLDASTVHDNGVRDYVYGGVGQNWYLAHTAGSGVDSVNGRRPSEILDTI